MSCCAGSTEFRRRADADLAAALREEMRGLVDEYEHRKQRAGKLDFVDLLIKVRDLVRDQTRMCARICRIASRICSSTNFRIPIRCKRKSCCCWRPTIPRNRTGDDARRRPGKLFLVGDPKQSIYKFRRADMVLYRQVRERLKSRTRRRIRDADQELSVPSETFNNSSTPRLKQK